MGICAVVRLGGGAEVTTCGCDAATFTYCCGGTCELITGCGMLAGMCGWTMGTNDCCEPLVCTGGVPTVVGCGAGVGIIGCCCT